MEKINYVFYKGRLTPIIQGNPPGHKRPLKQHPLSAPLAEKSSFSCSEPPGQDSPPRDSSKVCYILSSLLPFTLLHCPEASSGNLLLTGNANIAKWPRDG